jgi:hypothetical protein
LRIWLEGVSLTQPAGAWNVTEPDVVGAGCAAPDIPPPDGSMGGWEGGSWTGASDFGAAACVPAGMLEPGGGVVLGASEHAANKKIGASQETSESGRAFMPAV